MAPQTETAFRSCNLCEAICGLTIEHDGQQVISIKGDKEDPLSRGHICPKAIALQDIHADPDRLRTPVRRTVNGFEPISWDDAFDLVASKLTASGQNMATIRLLFIWATRRFTIQAHCFFKAI